MACSFRDPSSRILWQRCLCTCCTELSSPCNNAASWLCSFLSSPIKLIIKRFREFACAISTPFSVHRTIFRLPFDEIHLLSLQGFKAWNSLPFNDSHPSEIAWNIVLVVSGGGGHQEITIDSPIDDLSRAPRFASSSLLNFLFSFRLPPKSPPCCVDWNAVLLSLPLFLSLERISSVLYRYRLVRMG